VSNQDLHISTAAENRLTKPWEEFVPFPYDDQVAKRRQPNGRVAYTPWRGEARRGTISIGYGHTDAAGDGLAAVCGLPSPKIVPGIEITEQQASDLLAYDMRPCEASVKALVRVDLGQHQFDTLSDAVFNFGAGTLKKSTLLKRLNGGDYGAVPQELMKYVFAHNAAGELVRMNGLVKRRQAEAAWWTTPDDCPNKHAVPLSPEEHGVTDDDLLCPKGAAPPRRSPLDSKSVTAGGGLILTGGAVLSKVNEAAAPLREVQSQLQELGLWEHVVKLLSDHPVEIGVAIMIGLGVFVVGDRIVKLKAEHV
jgi:GH24 family phage-related lysozyme (muramidase)